MSGLFYNLGRRLGHAAIPAIRQSKWMWHDLTGTEEEVRRAEWAMGEALAVQLRAATEPAHDPEVSQWVTDLTRRLEGCLKEAHRDFHCEVIRAQPPNAIALPGGFLFLSDSLVNFCEREPDELAFVIGHEMAHVVRGHARERMRNQTLSRAASAVASRVSPMLARLQQKGLAHLHDAHSRESELEADEMGLRLGVAARFHPAGALRVLQRIARLGPDADVLGPFFASHPPAADRVAALQPLCRELSPPSSPE